MRALILTGFMGTGKSTVGRIVAERLKMPFVDTDEQIEGRVGMAVADIFASRGEEGFRALETEVLAELLGGGGMVLATGGGTLISERNRALLGETQTVICLTCREERLRERLSAGKRPLLRGGDGRVGELLAERAPIYRMYPQVETADRTPDEVAEAVIEAFLARPVATIEFPGTRRSDVYIAQGALHGMGSHPRGDTSMGEAVIITDQNVYAAGHYDSDWLSRWVAAPSAPYVLRPGEGQKTLETVEKILRYCLEVGLDRSGTIVGLGGGVVCDIAGMVAATYLRGVDLILVPTTLLAQVDAAIGGKVGVDLGQAKNAVGAFYPARVVVVDPDLLVTLPVTEMVNGAAEVIKTALIASEDLSTALGTVEGVEHLGARPDVLAATVSLKADIVRRDPYETGPRMLLNYGHTIGHAVEAASGYTLAHGSAVAIGMLAETRVAVERGWSTLSLSYLEDLLGRFGLPTTAAGVDAGEVLRLTGLDKKRSGRIGRWAFPVRVGDGAVREVDEEAMTMAARYAVGSA